MNEHDNKEPQAYEAPELFYESPELFELGAVEQLTKGQADGPSDNFALGISC